MCSDVDWTQLTVLQKLLVLLFSMIYFLHVFTMFIDARICVREAVFYHLQLYIRKTGGQSTESTQIFKRLFEIF